MHPDFSVMGYMAIGFLIALPLAVWKLVEIAIWFFSHLSWVN